MTEQGERMRELIERSSLGTPSAQAARRSVPVEQGQAIVLAAATNSSPRRPKTKSIQGTGAPHHL